MDIKTYSNFNPRPRVLTMQSNDTQTEQAGYMTVQQQVTELMISGRLLEEFRKLKYDTLNPSPDVDVPLNPTRKPGMELAEALQIARDANARINSMMVDITKDKVKDVIPPSDVKVEDKAPSEAKKA